MRFETWQIILLLWTLQVRGEEEGYVSTEISELVRPRRFIPRKNPGPVESATTIENSSSSNTNSPIKSIDELKGLSHGISSGKIEIVTNNTLIIPNFYFDGKAPNAHFLVGKGRITPDNGKFVTLAKNPGTPLELYDGQDLSITLPENLTISDIDWLAVWCTDVRQKLGYVFLNKVTSPYPPQTFKLKNVVTSGPIVLVNKKTLFIPDFRYKGDHKNVHFWAGNGTEPGSDGITIPDEKGSLGSLGPYNGQNLNISLPEGINTDNIEYFGVWSVDENSSLGYVILKGIRDVPEAPEDMKPFLGNEMIMRVPKCCPVASVITTEGCDEISSAKFQPQFKVFRHNTTHFNNISLDLSTIKFEPYTSSLECNQGKYPLDDTVEEFALLQNGSLLVKGSAITGILTQQGFCMDYIDSEEKMYIFVCVPEHQIQHAMFTFYVTLTFISTFCFAGTFFVYFFWLRIEDVHRKCFTAYVAAMTITFSSLTTVQLAYVEGSGCKILGFLFQFAMIASFTLLAILCFDIYVMVMKNSKNPIKKKRQTWYIIVALVVPIASLIVSLSRNQTPDVPNSFFKPQYHKNVCYFEEENQRSIFFYSPIILSIIVGVVFLILTKLRIIKNDKSIDALWIDNSKNFKFMLRKYLIVVAVSCLWPIDTIVHILFATTGSILIALEIIETCQGAIILLLFVLNKQSRTLILKKCKRFKKKKIVLNNTEEYLMKNMKS